MKKSRKKIINRLKTLIGKDILRIKPTIDGYYLYTDKPLTLVGFTKKGNLIVKLAGLNTKLPLVFTDWNWVSLASAKKSGNSVLNRWKGCKIARTSFVDLPPDPLLNGATILSDKFYYGRYQLIHANKHHIFLKNEDGSLVIADCRYANPNEWTYIGCN